MFQYRWGFWLGFAANSQSDSRTACRESQEHCSTEQQGVVQCVKRQIRLRKTSGSSYR